MNKLLYIIFGIVFLTMIGCASSTNPENAISITNLKGVSLHKITASSKLELFHNEWQNKQQVLTKKMPDFNFIISIPENGIVVKWLYSSGGYAMQKESKQAIIYKTDLSTLKELIEK